MRTVIAAVLAVTTTAGAASQNREPRVPMLPLPTGPHPVGRVTLYLTDSSRIEPLSTESAPRDLAVDVWYPAEAGTRRAAYLPASLLEDSAAERRLRPYFRGAFGALKASAVQTHATEHAVFAKSVRRAPVLVFSHGGGEIKEAYTAQLEDLASHGYVVAAIAHTYDTAVTVLAGGRTAYYSPRRWPPMTRSFIDGVPPSEQANPDQLRWWSDDIMFTIDQLTQVNRTASAEPFSGRLDLSKIGAFGHSFGGEAAATACQRDRRLRACLDEDGLAARAPYYPAADGWGMDQAFLLIVRAGPAGLPPDDELARMKLTRAEATDLLNRMDRRQLDTLQHTGQRSYRVVLEPMGTAHGDFGDLSMLQASSDTEADSKAAVMAVVRTYARAFFDATLKKIPSAVLESHERPPLVRAVEIFPPAKRRP
jgi:predicted dienelactone hydrolase